MNNIKDTISYYYINPNILYLNSFYDKTKNDLYSNPDILNPFKIHYSTNKIKNKNYTVLQPHTISLSNNKKYEYKLKIGYSICFIIILIFLIIYTYKS